MEKLIIDRIEGNFAVCEKKDRTMLNLEISKIPEEAKEGSCICIDENGFVSLDYDCAKDRKERTERLLYDLLE